MSDLGPCDLCEQDADTFDNEGNPLCEGCYGRQSARMADIVEMMLEEQRLEERRRLEAEEMDRHFREHPHG